MFIAPGADAVKPPTYEMPAGSNNEADFARALLPSVTSPTSVLRLEAAGDMVCASALNCLIRLLSIYEGGITEASYRTLALAAFAKIAGV
jgi:hypothetical protein